MACTFYFARCININSLLAQLVKYDVHTTRKIKFIHAICYHIIILLLKNTANVLLCLWFLKKHKPLTIPRHATRSWAFFLFLSMVQVICNFPIPFTTFSSMVRCFSPVLMTLRSPPYRYWTSQHVPNPISFQAYNSLIHLPIKWAGKSPLPGGR